LPLALAHRAGKAMAEGYFRCADESSPSRVLGGPRPSRSASTPTSIPGPTLTAEQLAKLRKHFAARAR